MADFCVTNIFHVKNLQFAQPDIEFLISVLLKMAKWTMLEEVFREESNVKKILALMLTSFLILAGCQTILSSEPQVSNLVDKSSLTEVKKRLEATLPEEDVNQFL